MQNLLHMVLRKTASLYLPGAIWSHSLDMLERCQIRLVRPDMAKTPRNPAAGKCQVTLPVGMLVGLGEREV